MAAHTKPRILIVDDSSDIRLVLHLALERAGWEVLEAEDGINALETTAAKLPDVVMLDYNMPQLNGVDVCRAIKSNPLTAHIAVVIFTGAFSDGIREAAFEAGAADFLTKPFLPNELRQRMAIIYQNRLASAGN